MFMRDAHHTGQSATGGPQKNFLYWKYYTGSEIVTTPVLGDDGAIYFGSIDGIFHALNATGKSKWTYSTNGELYASAVIDTNGVIYFGSEDGYFYALQKDGVLKWQYKTSGSISSSAVINPQNGDVFFGADDNTLYALDTSGALKWKSLLDEEIWTSPAMDTSNVLFIATLGGTVYALNASDGTVKWTYESGDIITGSPSIDEDNGSVIIASGEGNVYALNKDNGAKKWTRQIRSEISSTPAIDTATDANALYIGAFDGNLYALDRKTGAIQWKYKTNDSIFASAAIDKDGNVYLGSEDGNMYSVDKNGTLRWKYLTEDEINSSPSIGADGVLFVGSADGNLYAIGSVTVTLVNADFTATPTSGRLPLTVQFTDQSTGAASAWEWDFGDNTGDFSQNPLHTYTKSGTYTVSLKVTGAGGSTDTETKTNYISVTRKTSSVELNVSTKEITFGESLTLAGKINPAREAQVTLYFTHTDEDETVTETVTSKVDGSFALQNYFPIEGGPWDVKAKWEGDEEYGGAESDTLSFTVHPAELSLTITSSSSAIQIDKTVDISGNITLTPDNETTRNEALDEKLKLIRIDPNNSYEDIIEVNPFVSGGQLQYKFEGANLPEAGIWNLSVGFDKDDSFLGTSTDTLKIEVQGASKETAGYAILLEGSTEDKSGLDSHNLTLNSIYEKLLERGFTEEDVYYFNTDVSQDGVDEKPTKKGVLDSIKTWARDKMNETPAPLFAIFVGHGKKEQFLIYSDKDKKYDNVSANDIADALTRLESNLITNAATEPIVVVLGANRSGSFIPKLSKSGTNRIIITSADTEEIAYKGPLPPDETVRHGDYFVWEFFQFAAQGMSLKKCYESAADQMEEFTENEKGNGLITVKDGLITAASSSGNGQYFDFVAQHPLLDDNGDGVGAYGALSSLAGKDGGLSANLVLGIGTPTTSLELTESTGLVTLEADGNVPSLFARVNDAGRVADAWTEIAIPGHSLKNDKDATEQQVVNLSRFSYTRFDEAENKYIWDDFSGSKDSKTLDDFKKPGTYEVFYFALDSETDEFTPFRESDVVKNAANNTPPATFTFLSPANGTDTTVALTFDWEDSIDNDSKKTTYTFMISENPDFNPIYYQKKGLTESIVIVDKSAGLRDGATYYWRVLAIDSDGGITFVGASSGTSTSSAHTRNLGMMGYNAGSSASTGTSSSFTPKLANGYPGFVKGYVYDKDTNVKLAGATVTKQGLKGSATTAESGAYILQLPSGAYTLSVEASGYDTATSTVSVSALGVTTENIGLVEATQPASVFGKVKDKKGKPLQDVTITAKMKTVTKTATTGSDGSYSIADLSAGKYKLTMSKSGYKKYKATVTLAAGQNKKLNVKMDKKK